MPAKIDLTNKIFGRLTVLKQGDNIQTPNGRSHVAWICQCECGNIITVRGDLLRNGSVVSCGCKKKEILASEGRNRASDFVGKHFGHLTILKDSSERDNKGGIVWECQCDCGNITYVSTSNLTRPNGATISCGCVKSKGEEKIITQLIKLQIPFIFQKKFDNCIYPKTGRQLIFDFYLPEQNLLLEYDGEQHFHPIKNDRFNYEELIARDMYKTNWCKENNIKLVRIPYTDFVNIDENYMRTIIQKNGWREV